MFFNIKARLLELLLNDKDIQKAILDLVEQNSKEEKIRAQQIEPLSREIHTTPNETHTVFDTNCAEQRAAIQIVEQLSILTNFPHFQRAFSNDEDKLHTIIQFCSDLGHICLLWDELEFKCKEDGNPLVKSELNILDVCVHQYNKHQKAEDQIQLQYVEKGHKYDYEIHKQAFSSQGDRIKYCVIPGLMCVNGKIIKKTVVCTEK